MNYMKTHRYTSDKKWWPSDSADLIADYLGRDDFDREVGIEERQRRLVVLLGRISDALEIDLTGIIDSTELKHDYTCERDNESDD